MRTSARTRYAGYRFSAEIIGHAVWLYFRFPLGLRMVEELLAARGITVSHETVRQWARKFGQPFANRIRRRLPGNSEEILGRAIKDFARRDEVVIATKVYGRMRPGPNGAGLSHKAIFAEIDNSLRRLGTDYVDLYQIHRFDHDTPIEETLEALHDVVKAGKARYIGASSMHAWRFARALGIAEKNGWTRFVSMQNLVNLLYREEEREMLPLCAA